MMKYLQEIKQIANNLASSSCFVPDQDLVIHMLSGLPHNYDSFSTSIRVRSQFVTSDEFEHNLLH